MTLTLSSEPRSFSAMESGRSEAGWSGPDSQHALNVLLTMNFSLTSGRNATQPFDPLGGHSVWQVVLIVLMSGSLSLITITGNILVLVSFQVNKQLKTVNNYYLLSLAFADLVIGVLSMNLYTTYLIMGQWALGSWACDLWLAVDYVASNASVMNLLVISFDRYFSVTRPLTYRAKRTTKRAMTMICLAWTISFILWAPAILFWQYFVGERTVRPGECYIQFLTEPITTFCTAIAAFYLPVTIMSVLYWRIYKETENRSKELAGLKGSGNQGNHGSQEESGAVTSHISSSRSHSSGELQPMAQRRSAKKSGAGFCWLTRRRGLNWSSSDSWNNNEMGASIDQDEDEEEDADEQKAVRTLAEGPETLDSESQLSRKGLSKLSNHFIPDSFSSNVWKDPPGTNISIKDAAAAKRFISKAKMQASKRKKMSLVKEKKAAQTLSAILLAFIITWTPYNIMVLVNTFCVDCVPGSLWALGYWLCYVNSTVNPMCYALCNRTFRSTFRSLMLCQGQPHIQTHGRSRLPRPSV